MLKNGYEWFLGLFSAILILIKKPFKRAIYMVRFFAYVHRMQSAYELLYMT